MDNKNALQPSVDTDKYVFSSPGVWVRKGGQFWGTLGLTASGRLEFTLKDGKLIFSVPLSLTKYRTATSQATFLVVIGSYRYTIQFFEYQPAGLALHPGFAQYAAAQKGRPTIRAWVQKLAAFTVPSADDEPIVAVCLPHYLAPAAQLGRQGVPFFLAYTAIMVPAVLIRAGLAQANVHTPRVIDLTIAASIVTWLVGGTIWSIRRRNRLMTTALPSPSPEDLKTSPEDILPAGTQPTASLGISTGVALLLGFAVAGMIIGLPYLVKFLVSGTK